MSFEPNQSANNYLGLDSNPATETSKEMSQSVIN